MVTTEKEDTTFTLSPARKSIRRGGCEGDSEPEGKGDGREVGVVVGRVVLLKESELVELADEVEEDKSA